MKGAFLVQDIFFMTLTKISLAELPQEPSLPPSTKASVWGMSKPIFPNPEKNYL